MCVYVCVHKQHTIQHLWIHNLVHSKNGFLREITGLGLLNPEILIFSTLLWISMVFTPRGYHNFNPWAVFLSTYLQHFFSLPQPRVLTRDGWVSEECSKTGSLVLPPPPPLSSHSGLVCLAQAELRQVNGQERGWREGSNACGQARRVGHQSRCFCIWFS